MKLLLLTFGMALLSGCASVINDSEYPMRVETVTTAGTIPGGDCTATNEHGAIKFKSGDTPKLRRSYKDLQVVCVMKGYPKAEGRVISRTNAGFYGNVLVGGAIGAVVDASRGAAYSYPEWIQLSFGQQLVFDPMYEQHGTPVMGYAVGTSAPPSPYSRSRSASDQCLHRLPGAVCD